MGIGIAGVSVLVLGLVLLVVPVPGTTFVIMPLGLAILAKEFPWARRLLTGCKALLQRALGCAGRIAARVRLASVGA